MHNRIAHNLPSPQRQQPDSSQTYEAEQVHKIAKKGCAHRYINALLLINYAIKP